MSLIRLMTICCGCGLPTRNRLISLIKETASKNIAKNCNVSDSLGHISLDFFDYDRIISLDFFNSYQIICLDYFFFVSLQRENS